jgi:hypothetical protein
MKATEMEPCFFCMDKHSLEESCNWAGNVSNPMLGMLGTFYM